MSQKQAPPTASGNNPRGDVSFIRATPTGPFPPQSPTSGREKNTGVAPYPHPPAPHSSAAVMAARGVEVGGVGWSEREEMLSRELEEARVRVAQMEKTMRWWSDCTANWRDKWNKARNERNKAREENRMLRTRLDASIKECSSLKRGLRAAKTPTDSELPVKSPAVDDSVTKGEKEKMAKDFDEKDTDDLETVTSEDRLSSGPPDVVGLLTKTGRADGASGLIDENANDSESTATEKVSLLQLHEKDTLTRTIEQLQGELSSVRVKCDEIKQSKQELIQQVAKMREDHQSELGRLNLDLEDESSRTTSMDRRLTELRRELERLQAENAAEWGKRERLETEKQSLERENRKLRSNVNDLEEQLQRKHQQAAASVDSDLRTLQFDLAEKNKELTELRHTHNKLRKTMSERVTELEHTKRRADQYEAEVKKLRARVEELKRDLATAEDEVDMQANSVRRLQRSNDELQEQVDNLTVQVDHLQNRLRRGSQTLPKTRSSSLKSFNMEDSAELADSEDDLEDT
ncbi:hypothetical protein BaRGS_00016530 [Batillaria attramentaria]|uniref:Coiled-coil domain-containing protein 102A n=1 Tax=Batillaria attramentaria TaxID=370345 RepID=A0ABD0KY69_9CAEN